MRKERSIASVPDFVDFNKRRYDIGAWIAYGPFLERTGMSGMSVPRELSNIKQHFYINFEKGELTISGTTTPKDGLFNKYPIFKKDFDRSLLSAFPDKSYATVKMSLNIPAFFDMIEDMARQMGESSPFRYMDRSVRTIIDGLEGEVLFSMYDFARGSLPLPLAGVVFSVNNRGVFDRIIDILQDEMGRGAVRDRGDYHEVSLVGVGTLYLAHKDNKIYITVDSEAINNFTGRGYRNSLSGSQIAKSPVYMYLNLDVDSYPDNVHSFLRRELGREIADVLDMMKPLKDLTVYSDSSNDYVYSLNFKSKENSLKQILMLIDDAIGRNW